MGYMDHLQKMALECAGLGRPDETFAKASNSWYDIEEIVKSRGWDIFDADMRQRLRGEVHRLIGLLYQLDGTPGTDIAQLKEKDKSYGGSWCKRGGVGAFMMLARKWDRIQNAFEKEVQLVGQGAFAHLLETDTRPEGIRDDIGDLRRYLLLVLCWMEDEKKPEIKPLLPRLDVRKELDF